MCQKSDINITFPANIVCCLDINDINGITKQVSNFKDFCKQITEISQQNQEKYKKKTIIYFFHF